MKNNLKIIIAGETAAGKSTIAHAIRRELSKFDIDVDINDTEEMIPHFFEDNRLNRRLESMSGRKIPLDVVHINKKPYGTES